MDLRRFWDIDSSNIQLVAFHGTTALDQARMTRVLTAEFGFPDSEAKELAALLAGALNQPKFRYGNHPLLTFNAFAVTPHPGDPAPIRSLPDKLLMGDGILTGFRELGYGDVAPQVIVAHEFGHHVQFDKGVDFPGTPEGTRRTELMADALAAYDASHPRGVSMQWKRVRDALQVVYGIGDCFFAAPGHHGTPDQRLRAADWAYRLQEAARPKGKIVTAAEFIRLFDAALPGLVAPDA